MHTEQKVIVPDPDHTDRTALWLPLLQQLTDVAPSWLVWKNAESAFSGVGDIDAAAAAADWPVIERTFVDWAAEHGVGPTVVCRHIPGGLNLIAVPDGWATFLEMGTKARRFWRGSTLFVLEDLESMLVMDPRGFRRLRPGAEGLFKLLLNGTRRSGRPDLAALEAKGVRELLQADPDGVRQAAALLGPASHAAVVGARHAAAGGWSWPAMLAVEGWATMRGLADPRSWLARLRFRLRGRATCPVVEAILGQGRRIPSDREGWIRELSVDHLVYPGAFPTGTPPD